MFSKGSGAAGGLDAVETDGTSGAPSRLAREDASEEEVAGAGITGASVFFAAGVTDAASFTSA